MQDNFPPLQSGGPVPRANSFGYVDHAGFGGSGADLVYGQRPDGTHVQISLVPSGLACGCTCPACGKTLVARKGPKKVDHFAHYGAGTGCGRGAETNAHIWAKNVLQREKRIKLPAVTAQIDRERLQLYAPRMFTFADAHLEKALGDIVPDVILTTKDGRRLLVEVLVTHACGPEKIRKLHAKALPTVEVDLGAWRTSSDRAAIEQALLEAAPRAWLYNDRSAVAEQKLRQQIAEREATSADHPTDPKEGSMTIPTVLRLQISRFRGIKALDWHPAAGLNLILGGGDVGKTTILDAICLLLSPVNPANLPDTDFFGREIEGSFSIAAVLSLPPGSGINTQMKPSWPWEWNGKEAVAPSLDGPPAAGGDAVYCVRVRGTEDLELYYEVVQPDGTADSFPVALRRQIGLVRLGGDDRNDRDLRLVQGSALDRLLSDKGLRSRMASTLADTDIKEELGEPAKASLAGLDTEFKTRRLPSDLDLQITGGQGASIASMVGLTAQRDGMTLPLASWGAGTRRLAALAIAEQNQGQTPITVVDEIERGLEPYRQRVLIDALQEGGTQVFVTSHSPAAISAAAKAALWYVDHEGHIGRLEGDVIDRHRSSDPEMFLSRLAIIAEGRTEQGVVIELITRGLGGPLAPHGVHVCDGGGHEDTLKLLEALAASGLRFGGFADEENLHPTRWLSMKEHLGALLFRWESGCIEEEVINAIADDQLEALVTEPSGLRTGMRLRFLAARAGIEAKDFASIRVAAGDQLKPLILAAMLGKVPVGKEAQKREFQAQAQRWFKSREGGAELGQKIFALGLWPAFAPRLMPFCNAVRGAVGLEALPGLIA